MEGYDWDFSFLGPYMPAFGRGLLVTLWLSVIASALGTFAGLVVGLLASIRWIRLPLLVANDLFRAIPILVLLFGAYFFPYRALLGVSPPSAFWCAVIGLSISQAAFVADLVRAALDEVPSELVLAARALGLSERQVWRVVVLPDVIRQILPAVFAFCIGIFKYSSLASVIGCEDVVFVARTAMIQRLRSVEAWLFVAAIYIALVIPLSLLTRRVERSRWIRRRASRNS